MITMMHDDGLAHQNSHGCAQQEHPRAVSASGSTIITAGIMLSISVTAIAWQ